MIGFITVRLNAAQGAFSGPYFMLLPLVKNIQICVNILGFQRRAMWYIESALADFQGLTQKHHVIYRPPFFSCHVALLVCFAAQTDESYCSETQPKGLNFSAI